MFIYFLFVVLLLSVKAQNPTRLTLNSTTDGGSISVTDIWNADCGSNNGSMTGVYIVPSKRWWIFPFKYLKCGYFKNEINQNDCNRISLSYSNVGGTVDVNEKWLSECDRNGSITAIWSNDGYSSIDYIKCCKTKPDFYISYDNCTRVGLGSTNTGGSNFLNETWNAECPNSYVVVAFWDDNDGYTDIDSMKCCQLKRISCISNSVNPTVTKCKSDYIFYYITFFITLPVLFLQILINIGYCYCKRKVKTKHIKLAEEMEMVTGNTTEN